MTTGDRVRHKRMGYAKIVKSGLAGGRVKIELESTGETKVIAPSRLQPAPATDRDTSTAEGDTPRQSARRDRSVPYELMARAKAYFEAERPDADEVRPLLSGDRVYCEIWKDNHADIIFYVERT